MIEIEIEDDAWTAALPEAAAVAERAATAALGAVEGGVVVLLADDETVRDLNARFRDRDRPTNVLSFPAAEMSVPSQAPPLGDIVLAYGVCAAEAAAQGKTLADHLSHLTVHGVLHLLGRDHEAEAEAEEMEAEERSILATLGVADPYRADAQA
ncbi:rRNA maturation RNase YbeY [Roseibacterium beibuensis]|uniref:rRNA maturation RNase YbeY n=1 Tax=[Roseibacterium] beibuensis TaxID=1193142 RepID=UPI00217CFB53|nr:rRNA maturation RNase YbeY [Roseibacterium beibuensis]MCS6626345.1 rRNA maturation RNase YbeY [Roseibacterium beibuensis]